MKHRIALLILLAAAAPRQGAATTYPDAVIIRNWPSWRFTYHWPTIPEWNIETGDLNGVYARVGAKSGYPVYENPAGRIEVYSGGVSQRGFRFRINKPNEFGNLWTVVAQSTLYSDGPFLTGEYAGWRKRTDNNTTYDYPSKLPSPYDPETCVIDTSLPDHRCLTREPIDLITGNMVMDELDLAIPCPGPDLVLGRAYSSGGAATNSGFGPRWTHSYHWHLPETTTDYIKVTTGAGRTFTLERQGSGDTWQGYRDNNWTAYGPTNGEYRVYLPGRVEYLFAADGRLSSIADPWDNKVTLSYSNGLLSRVAHSCGQGLNIAAETGRITRVDTVLPGLSVQYGYNAHGELASATQVTSRGDFPRTYRYDETPGPRNHSLTQRINAAGETATYTYATNASGETLSRCIAMALDPDYYAHTVEYPGGPLSGHADVDYALAHTNQALTYHYDTDILKVTQIVGPGSTNLATEYEYDRLRVEMTRQEVRDEATGESMELSRDHDDYHHVTSEAFGYCAAAADPWLCDWDIEYGVPTRLTDAEGHVTEFEYTNGALAVARVLDAGGQAHETHYDYDQRGLLTTYNNANGHWVNYAHNALGFATNIVSQAGPSIGYEYDTLGNVTGLILPPAFTTNAPGGPARRLDFDTDELGRIHAVAYPDNETESFAYDAAGRLTNHVDRAGRPTWFAYLPTRKLQAMSRLVSGTNLTLVSIDYDQQFNTVMIRDALDRPVESYALDIQDRVAGVTNAEGQVMSLQYGVADFLRSATRFDGTTIDYAYDSGGRLSEVHTADGANVFTYLRNGLLAAASNQAGTVAAVYSPANRLTSVTGPSPSSTLTCTYLPAGQVSTVAGIAGVTAYGYDAAERVTNVTSPEVSFSLAYDPSTGLPSGLHCAGAPLSASYAYDVLDRLAGISWRGAGDAPLMDFAHTYDAAGRLSRIVRESDAVVVYGYDDLDRLTAESRYDAASNLVSSQTYTYDAAGNRLTKHHDGVDVVFSYEPGGNRLSGWSVTTPELCMPMEIEGFSSESIDTQSGYGELWVSNDVVVIPEVEGNWFRVPARPVALGPHTVVAAIRDAAGNVGFATNELLLTVVTNGAYAYDAAGCLTNITLRGAGYSATKELEWDALYRLRAVSTNGVLAEAYTYDALGRRIAISNALGTTHVVYDGIHPVTDVDAGGAPLRSYTYGPGIDNILAMTVYAGPETNVYCYVTDHLGTVRSVTDTAGAVVESYTYDAWGRVTVSDGAGNLIPESAIGNRFLFQGREYSWATGLYYFRARHYDPITARWLSKDPIRISGGLNQYTFCANNPVMLRDPSGLWEFTIGAGLGFAGRISFGKNNGRWNIKFGLGYGIGLSGSFAPEDADPQFASDGLAARIGLEVSGEARVWGLDLSGGLQAHTASDECGNVENRLGGFGSVRVPGTTVKVGGPADVVIRGNLNRGSIDAFGEVQRAPVTIGLGGMVFGGVTGGVAWDGS